MYSLLTMSPFRLPSDPGPMAVYYPPPVEIVDAQGDPVLNLAGNPTHCDTSPQREMPGHKIFERPERNFGLSLENPTTFFPQNPTL